MRRGKSEYLQKSLNFYSPVALHCENADTDGSDWSYDNSILCKTAVIGLLPLLLSSPGVTMIGHKPSSWWQCGVRQT